MDPCWASRLGWVSRYSLLGCSGVRRWRGTSDDVVGLRKHQLPAGTAGTPRGYVHCARSRNVRIGRFSHTLRHSPRCGVEGTHWTPVPLDTSCTLLPYAARTVTLGAGDGAAFA